MRRIISQFSGKCARCGKPYEKGNSVWYDGRQGRGRKVWHVVCNTQGDAPQPQPSQPQPSQPQPSQPQPSQPQQQQTEAWPFHIYRKQFDSVDEAFAYSRNKPSGRNGELWQGTEDGKDDSGIGWYGIVGGVKAVNALIASGQWPDGVARMNKALGSVAADLRPRSIRRTRVRRDFGTEVDVTEYWRGRADVAWTNCERQQRTGPQTVTVAVNLSISATQHADHLFWRGAAALALADKLTTAGYNVELIALSASRNVGSGKHEVIEMTIKPATAPLDLNALAVSACLSGFFRKVVFQITQNSPFTVDCGLGQPALYRDLIGAAVDPRTMFIAECGSESDAREFVQGAINQLQGNTLAAAA